MSEDEFSKLFRYVSEQFETVNRKLDEKASQHSLDSLTNAIDSFIKRLDSHDANMAARDSQFERLLEWARMVSVKTGIPFKNL